MTPFTDIGAAIEEAAWLSHVYQTPYCVYQRTADVMEVSPQDLSRNAMYTAGAPGVITNDYRSAA